MEILLLVSVLLPLAGSVLLFLSPRWDHATARWVALATALVTLGISEFLIASFPAGDTAPHFAFHSGKEYGLTWLGSPNVRFALGLDGISLWLHGLTSLLVITAIFSSWESVKERAPAHYALLLALETGLLGLFSSLDVVLFYIFFEFTLIPLFFLIGLYGGPERRRASITFFLYTLAGSLLTLLGVILLIVWHYQSTGDLTFSILELGQGLNKINAADWATPHHWGEWGDYPGLFMWSRWPAWWGRVAAFWTSPQVLIFMLLFAGFAIKVPLFPFHTWLPLAHVEAPTAGSILLAGVLLKVGSYGFLRFNLSMTPLGAQALFPFLATIAVIGIIYGALTALAQTDVKRLVAYSSVSHMGFVALGMFALNRTGLEGSVMQMLNHGLTTGALFACVGVIYERYHTREMGEMSGLWVRLPLLAFFFILASLGSAAVPGLNGFVGEFPILLGMFARDPTFAVIAALGMILGAYYLLWMLQRVLFGPLREPGNHGHGHHVIRPVGWHEVAGLAPLMVLIVAIGVYPRPIFDRIKPAVDVIANRLDHARDRPDARIVAVKAVPPSSAQDRAR